MLNTQLDLKNVMLISPVNEGMNLGYRTEAWTCQVSQMPRFFAVSSIFKLRMAYTKLKLLWTQFTDIFLDWNCGTKGQRPRE